MFDPNNGDTYITNATTGNVSVIGPADTVIQTITGVDPGPDAAAFDPTNGDIYVADGYGAVSVIDPADTNAVIDNIAGGSEPEGIAFDPTDGNIYVTNEGSNTVSVIDPANNHVIDTLTVGTNPIRPAWQSIPKTATSTSLTSAPTSDDNPGSITVITRSAGRDARPAGPGSWSVETHHSYRV